MARSKESHFARTAKVEGKPSTSDPVLGAEEL